MESVGRWCGGLVEGGGERCGGEISSGRGELGESGEDSRGFRPVDDELVEEGELQVEEGGGLLSWPEEVGEGVCLSDGGL